MKIAWCILILTFAVYLEYVDCSSGASGSATTDLTQSPSPVWKYQDLGLLGIIYLKDPVSGQVIDIQLAQNQGPRELGPKVGLIEMKSTQEGEPVLHFVVFVDLKTGRKIAAAPMNEEYQRIVNKQAARRNLDPLIRGYPERQEKRERIARLRYDTLK